MPTTQVGQEKDWPEDFCRHLVERTLQVMGWSAGCQATRPGGQVARWPGGQVVRWPGLWNPRQDHELALLPPSRIAHAIFTILKTADPSTLRLVSTSTITTTTTSPSSRWSRGVRSASPPTPPRSAGASSTAPGSGAPAPAPTPAPAPGTFPGWQRFYWPSSPSPRHNCPTPHP